MSVESAKSFIERMKSDQEFARKVNELKSREEAMRYIASQGYDFTFEQFAGLSSVLTDAELSSVAGGAAPPCQPTMAMPPGTYDCKETWPLVYY